MAISQEAYKSFEEKNRVEKILIRSNELKSGTSGKLAPLESFDIMSSDISKEELDVHTLEIIEANRLPYAIAKCFINGIPIEIHPKYTTSKN